MDGDRTSNGKLSSTEDVALHGGMINRRSARSSRKTDCFYYEFDLIDSGEEWGRKRPKKRPKKEGKAEVIRKGFIAALDYAPPSSLRTISPGRMEMEDDKDWVRESEKGVFRIGVEEEKEIGKIDGAEKIGILESDGGPVCDKKNVNHLEKKKEVGEVMRLPVNKVRSKIEHSNGDQLLGNEKDNVRNEKRRRSKKIEPGGLSDATNSGVSSAFRYI